MKSPKSAQCAGTRAVAFPAQRPARGAGQASRASAWAMDVSKDDLSAKGRLLSDCMLGQYMGTAAGLGIGLAVGFQRKSLRSFVIAVTAGTLADWWLGYTGNCRPQLLDYQEAKKAYDNKLKAEKMNQTK